MRISHWLSVLAFGGLALSVSQKVFAADPKGGTEGDDKNASSEESNTGADIKENDQQKKELNPDDIQKALEAEKADSPAEDPKNTYYFVGLRYRAHVIPKFMINLFGDGGATVVANGIGPEVTMRKDAFEYVFSAWWTGYYMDWKPFKGSSDPEKAWEMVKSRINVLYLTTDFNWTKDISPVVGVNIGVGAGLGFVWGDLHRVQAYKGNNGSYVACERNPDSGGDSHGDYCGTDNDHYGNYTEGNWANGGQKPMFFPWLAVGPGLRIKPHRNFMMRIDAGWGLVGPYFGIAGNYGL